MHGSMICEAVEATQFVRLSNTAYISYVAPVMDAGLGLRNALAAETIRGINGSGMV
jgi:hypothetical protein